MRKIVPAPSSVLTTPAKKVEKFDSALKKLVSEMEKTLVAQTDPQGVGLAAVQIGESLQVFIMKPKPTVKTEVFVNPTIVSSSKKKIYRTSQTAKKHKSSLEGCLSVARIWAPIRRSNDIILEYQDMSGKKKTKKFLGFKSVIVQHEVDHLNGVLFTQRATEQKATMYEEKAGKLKKLEI